MGREHLDELATMSHSRLVERLKEIACVQSSQISMTDLLDWAFEAQYRLRYLDPSEVVVRYGRVWRDGVLEYDSTPGFFAKP